MNKWEISIVEFKLIFDALMVSSDERSKENYRQEIRHNLKKLSISGADRLELNLIDEAGISTKWLIRKGEHILMEIDSWDANKVDDVVWDIIFTIEEVIDARTR